MRMDNIHFDETGKIKLQEMSHVFFDQYKLSPSDLIFLPPEALSHSKLSDKADVWTLGILILLCISLEFDFQEFICKYLRQLTFAEAKSCTQQVIDALHLVKSPSLL